MRLLLLLHTAVSALRTTVGNSVQRWRFVSRPTAASSGHCGNAKAPVSFPFPSHRHISSMNGVMISQSSRQGAPTRAPRPILVIIIIIIALRGQYYISSTFAGTRPRRPSALSQSSENNSWQICASILREGLQDVGDAASTWLAHAYVGSNQYPTNEFTEPSQRYQCRCLIPQLHVKTQPLLTAIVQSFNHHANIPNISTSLRASSIVQEIVISEDGSTDGSLHDWRAALPDPHHFIIRSNNLHELRSYNRAMRMSSGDIVVLLQDDDLLPFTDDWLKHAIKLFDALPELGVLGGYIGQLWDHSSGQGFEYGEQISTHGGLRQGNTKPLPYIEPKTKLPFMYAECVWIAPVFIRRELLRKAGGLELTIAKRGEPGVWQDCVFSYEAWTNGYTVGTYSAPFKRGVGGHGSATSTIKVKQRERVYERAVAYTNRKYPRRRIHDSIVARNNETLLPRAFVNAFRGTELIPNAIPKRILLVGAWLKGLMLLSLLGTRGLVAVVESCSEKGEK